MSLLKDQTTERELPAPPSTRVVTGAGVLVIGAFVAALFVAMALTSYQTWGALFLSPILIAVSLPLLSRQASKEGDGRIFRILLIALIAKLIGALVAYYVAFDVYGGVADAAVYHNRGLHIAERFRQGNFDTGLTSIEGTSFPSFLNGIIYTIIGPTKLGGFLVHSWLGFWGLFFFYRAFLSAVPNGNSRHYALLLFFLPSLLMWSSLMGKEPWMVMTLGISSFGIARLLSGRALRGLLIAGLGLWLSAIVRPHLSAMVAIAAAAAYLLARPRSELRQLAPIAKTVGLVAVLVVASILVARTDRFLKKSRVDTDKGLVSALEDNSRRADTGGSRFAPAIVRSPAGIPRAAITVLFRPFVFEVNNVQGMVAALEGLFLAGFCLLRFRWGWQALLSVRRQPYVAFALVFTAVFILGFSSIPNFGLLVRERVQLLPFFLVLFSIPPVGKPTE